MEADLVKLFIGGISWDTNEDRLREYFKAYGEVMEAVIMKDRTTGRARGFGFIVFADPAAAERVVMEKHIIDGRKVEAKKAVPRDDQHILSSNNSNIHGSPGPARTKKIFVGGLASTVTENDFKQYFDQFGTITDVVVMYDHNTQRPRGFGFITYDSEDAVENVLIKTFHDLGGKLVEVKRAVPKELSPVTNRSPLRGFGLNMDNSFLNGYTQGYNLSSLGAHGLRLDGRFGPIATTRSECPPFVPPVYGMGMNFEHSFNTNYGGGTNFGTNIGYGQELNPYYRGDSSRPANAIGYRAGNRSSGSVISSTRRNVWGTGGLDYTSNSTTSNSYIGSGSGTIGGFRNDRVNWRSSPSLSVQAGKSGFGFSNGIYGHGNGAGGLGSNAYGQEKGTSVNPPSYLASNIGYDSSYGDLYGGSSTYGDTTWRSVTSELDASSSFGYLLGNAATDVSAKHSTGYVGG